MACFEYNPADPNPLWSESRNAHMDAKRPDITNGESQTRVNYRLPVAIEGDDESGKPFRTLAIIENVTRRGAFVETTVELKEGSLIGLVDADDSAHRLGYGQVVWLRDAAAGTPGVGMRLVGDNAKWMDYLIAHSVHDIADRSDGD